MTFGEDWGWGASKKASRKIFDAFANAGGNTIDTSVNYTNGTAEEFVGDFTSADRDYWVIATKYTLTRADQTDPNQGGNSRKNMYHSVERSLTRLQTDYIDILYLHMWDYMTPVEEVMRTFDDLVRSGKVRYVAFSDTPAWVVAEANTLVEQRGWVRPIALQVPYSLADRAVERAELPMARRWDMTVMAWGLLEGGLLTGKYTSSNTEPKREKIDELPERYQGLVTVLQLVADEVGVSPAQVAINWIRQSPQAQVIPILGARTLNQFEDNLNVMNWSLTDEQMVQLSEAATIKYGFPRDFLENGARRIIFGKTFDLIDNHRGNPVRL